MLTPRLVLLLLLLLLLSLAPPAPALLLVPLAPAANPPVLPLPPPLPPLCAAEFVPLPCNLSHCFFFPALTPRSYLCLCCCCCDQKFSLGALAEVNSRIPPRTLRLLLFSNREAGALPGSLYGFCHRSEEEEEEHGLSRESVKRDGDESHAWRVFCPATTYSQRSQCHRHYCRPRRHQ